MGDFLTSKDAQLQMIQSFLSGLAEVHEHHVASNEHRMDQFEKEFDCMASEYEIQQGSFDTTYNEIVKNVREETTEANIQRLVNDAKKLKADFIPNLKGYIREIGTFSRFHPDLIDYESTVYAAYLCKYFQNSEGNWTVPKLWEYDVTSKYVCSEIAEGNQELLSNWLKMLEKRKLHRGQLIETAYREPEPFEKKMEIIQKYFKTQNAAKPKSTITKLRRKKKTKEPKRSIYSRLNLYKTNEAALEKFKVNRTTPKFMKEAAIPKDFMDKLVDATKKKYLEIISSTQNSAKMQANARAGRRKMKSEFGLRKKIDAIEPKIKELETEIAPERLAKITQLKDGLQIQQRMASRTLNDMRERKDECSAQLNEATEALHLIPEHAEPKMQQATETSQRVELCDLAETQFEQAKNQVEIVVEKYTKWSAKKLDQVKVQLRNYIKPMMQEKLLDQSDKEAIKKMESLVHKACFLYNKDLSILLPEKIKEIEECRKRFHEEKFIPHNTDLMFIHQIDRALSNSQIQIASETSKVRQWLNNLESTVKTFCEHVENADPSAIRVDPTTKNRVTEVLFIVNERNRTNALLTEVVVHFMCSLSTLANVKREFYFNWLTAKTHQEFVSMKAEEAERANAAKRGSSSNLLGGMRKMSNLNLAKTASRKYSTMPGMGGGPRRIIRDPKIEVKVQIFGDFRAPTGEDLPSRMTRLLYDATNRILTLGDAYYRGRGARPITRPELIRENFERTCDFTVIKVVDFERKAKDFVHKCFMQVKDMVERFTLTGRPVLEMIFSETNKAIKNENAKAIQDVQDRYQKLFDALKDAGLEHNSKLRTSLGLPEHKEELANLEKNERDRHFKIHKYNIERHTELRSKMTEIVSRDATKICALAADLMTKEEKCISER